MQNKPVRFGPFAVPAAATNFLNPPTTAGGVNGGGTFAGNGYLLIKHLSVINKTGAPVNMSAFIGATGGSAAGTEFAWSATPVPGNGRVDFYAGGQGVRLDVADFLTVLASAGTSLVIEGEGEIGVA
jgi:hypothetical protein